MMMRTALKVIEVDFFTFVGDCEKLLLVHQRNEIV